MNEYVSLSPLSWALPFAYNRNFNLHMLTWHSYMTTLHVLPDKPTKAKNPHRYKLQVAPPPKQNDPLPVPIAPPIIWDLCSLRYLKLLTAPTGVQFMERDNDTSGSREHMHPEIVICQRSQTRLFRLARKVRTIFLRHANNDPSDKQR